MSVTIKDVAERAGVSIATVSYVLTGTKKVKDSTRDKVNKAIQELNYAPNLLAKGLKDKKSNLIGFITPNLSSPYYMSVIKMCEEQLKSQGYHMLVLSLDLQENDDTSAIRMLCNGHCRRPDLACISGCGSQNSENCPIRYSNDYIGAN